MDASSTKRIIILGKTGVGKSSLANTIFGEELFNIDHSANSETRGCRAKTKSVNGRSICLIDTPGFFDTDRSEEEMRPEILKCVAECAPGPHAFLIVLKVEKFTRQEQNVVDNICDHFSEEVFTYATVVFTHGDQLLKGQTIEEFVQKNQKISDLVKKCGGRCHVIDNKYWKENPTDKYRRNDFQVEELLKSLEKTVLKNDGEYYTNEMLEIVGDEIQQEEEKIRLLPENMTEEEIREEAKARVFEKILIRLAGIATGILLGALFGVVTVVGLVITALRDSTKPVRLREAAGTTAAVGGGAAVGMMGGALAAGAVGAAGKALIMGAPVAAVGGAARGGVVGYRAAEGAGTKKEAAKRAAEAVKNESQSVLNKAHDVFDRVLGSKVKRGENL